MILLDTGGLLAVIDAGQPRHHTAGVTLDADEGPFVVSPFVLCELDYLVTSRLGTATELELLDDVAHGAYELAQFDAPDVASARAVVEQYRDLSIGLADASIVVLAGRYATNRVLTFDERHFRALRTPQGDPFVVLPADA